VVRNVIRARFAINSSPAIPLPHFAEQAGSTRM
jgi:hypothetical protein